MVEACALTILPLQTVVISVTSLAFKVYTCALLPFESVSPSHPILSERETIAILSKQLCFYPF